MASIQPKDAIVVIDSQAFNCQTNSEVELDRDSEKIICHENAPGGALVLGEINGTMTVTGILADTDTNAGMEAAEKLIDGTQVTALFRGGPAGEKGIQFNAYITNVKITSDQTAKVVTWSATLSNTSTPQVVTLS